MIDAEDAHDDVTVHRLLIEYYLWFDWRRRDREYTHEICFTETP